MTRPPPRFANVAHRKQRGFSQQCPSKCLSDGSGRKFTVFYVARQKGAHWFTSRLAAPEPGYAAFKRALASAIQTSLPLIQKADANFMPKAACASCHNNSFAAMAVGSARKAGFQVDEKIARDQVKANVFGLEQLRDDLRQGFIGGSTEYFGAFVIADILIGLDAEHYKPDLNTDAAAMYILNRQMPDGHWPYPSGDGRPPICSDYVGQTAVALRALQLYAPQIDKAAYAQAIARANAWLVAVASRDNQDRLSIV
jgi:hypothetical protein